MAIEAKRQVSRALLKFKEALPPGRSASKTRSMVEGRKTRRSCCCSTAQHRCRQCPLSIACSLPWAGSLPRARFLLGGTSASSSRLIAESSARHPASRNEAYIGWWVGDEFHSVAAQFRDISSGGALILTREEPPNKHVWIGLARPVETRWCPARVVRVRETSVGLIEVGLAFHSPCNSVLFDAVVQRDCSA